MRGQQLWRTKNSPERRLEVGGRGWPIHSPCFRACKLLAVNAPPGTEDTAAGAKALLVIRGRRHLLEGQTTKQAPKTKCQSVTVKLNFDIRNHGYDHSVT